jgi:hypothetical protein
MHDLFAALLKQPNSLLYKKARAQWLLTRNSVDLTLQLAELNRMLQCELVAKAEGLANEMQPAGVLTLQWHRLVGEIARQKGDQQRAELHRFAYESIRSAILATGKGTRLRPYLIAHPSDAQEVLLAAGCHCQSQSLISQAGRHFDVLLADDEREYWFDITEIWPKKSEKMPASPRKQSSEKKSTRRRNATSRSRISRSPR